MADAMAVAFGQGIDGPRAVSAMRWEMVNPWGTTLEKFSSHPLVAHRIAALRRELQKLGRLVRPEDFGPYRDRL